MARTQSKETKKKISKSLKKFHSENFGSKSYFNKSEKNRKKSLGYKHKKESIEKMRKMKNALGSKRSIETRRKISNTLKSKKGGITAINRLIRCSEKYQQWRSDIFERDNWTCQNCRKRGYELHAHHSKRFSKILSEFRIKTLEQALKCHELWDLNNGVTLCKDCHKRVHKRVV